MGKGQFRGGGYGGMNQAAMMKLAYSASAGGGAVTATVSGKRELTELTIDPEAVDPEDVEMLQDTIMAAVNEAMRKAEEASAQSMSRLTGGLGGLGNLF